MALSLLKPRGNCDSRRGGAGAGPLCAVTAPHLPGLRVEGTARTSCTQPCCGGSGSKGSTRGPRGQSFKSSHSVSQPHHASAALLPALVHKLHKADHQFWKTAPGPLQCHSGAGPPSVLGHDLGSGAPLSWKAHPVSLRGHLCSQGIVLSKPVYCCKAQCFHVHVYRGQFKAQSKNSTGGNAVAQG